MNKTLSIALIVILGLVLAGGVFLAGTIYARATAYGPAMMYAYGWNTDRTFGPGMMNGRNGQGMMGSMMGGGAGGYGMMGGYGPNSGSAVTPLTVDQARAAAEKYLQSLDLQGLQTGEVMIFDNNAYVIVEESDAGLGAFELLVDPVSQVAYPEFGPNMMWNLKYGGLNHRNMMGGYGGMMGGMMGSGMMNGWNFQATPSASVPADMPVTTEQAVEYAQKYLDAYLDGATAASDPAQFYGYYTLDFTTDGKIAGMLSVNGYNGQVFLHTWHGTFIEEAD